MPDTRVGSEHQRPAHQEQAKSPVNTRQPPPGPRLDCKNMTTTIAIRPSPAIGSFQDSNFFNLDQTTCPTLPLSQAPKPKLSLNTFGAQRTVGRSNTGLRLDTLSAVSPTQKNTYKNTYEPPTAPGTPFCAVEPSHSPETYESPKTPTPHPLNYSNEFLAPAESSTPSPPSSSSSASTPEVPYSMPPSLHSILSNSPLPKSGDPQAPGHERRKSSSASTGSTGRRVCFRQPELAEEIKTVKYTVPHLDLLQPEVRLPAPPQNSSPRSEARAGEKRESPSEGGVGDQGDEPDDNGAYPKTPVAGRRKRRREWVWTLGPVPGAQTGCGESSRGDSGEHESSPTIQCN